MNNLIFAFSFGALGSLAMAPTSFPLALFIGLSSFYILVVKTETAFKAAMIGLFFSLGYFGFSLSWIGNALLVDDNPYWWAWPLAISGLPLILSFFTAVTCYVHKIICKNKNDLKTLLSFLFALFIAEYARGHLFTGFPWNLYGYVWADIHPIAQLASLHNVYLLTFITIFWAIIPGFVLLAENFRIQLFIAGLAIATLISSYFYGKSVIAAYQDSGHSNYEIVLVQPNIKQSEKWKIDKRQSNFLELVKLSKFTSYKNSVDTSNYYIIWPETAISQDLLDSPWAIQEISQMLKSYPSKANLITGALRFNRDTNTYYNSIISINSEGTVQHVYNKSHLVPFGEYMPFKSIIDIAPIVGFTGFASGDGLRTLSFENGMSFSPLICYEIIFPGATLSNDETKADVIINVTNDAWYGKSAGPYQHLVQSRFRAIETGLPVIRSANTGISAIINSLGQIEQKAELSKKDVIIHKLALN